jgi:3-methyladenine DNA glycosylase AlkD
MSRKTPVATKSKTSRTASRTSTAARTHAASEAPAVHDVDDVVAWLKQNGSEKVRSGMARYGIPSDHAFGIPVGTLQREAKRLGRSHALAEALWKTGHYEARMLAAFVAEPERVTSAQMERWVRDFDNWAICDTVCLHLFDRTQLAFEKVPKWAVRSDEFVKRAGFALLAALALHAKTAPDEPFQAGLQLIAAAAHDERNFVKKSVNWALRAIGLRSPQLHAAALETASELAATDDATARWIGKDALRQLAKRKPKKR